jgi:hypothetical protein
MSTHALAVPVHQSRLRALLADRLRDPSGVVFGNGLAAPPTALEFTPDLSADEQTILADVVTAAVSPDAAASLEQAQARTDVADQYAAAITRLNQIIDFVGTPTAAQVYDAVQDIALYLRKTLRYLESQR